MKEKQHWHRKNKNLLAFSLLVFTWVLLVFFLKHYQAYQEVVSRMNFIEIKSDTDVLIIKIYKKPEPRCGDYRCFEDQDFVDLYNQIELEGNEVLGSDQVILQEGPIDNYLKSFAESLGYQKRSFANEDELIEYNTLMTFPFIEDAYLGLRNDMSRDGIDLHFVSAYRSFEAQRTLFIDALNIPIYAGIAEGVHDEDLAKVLERSALPGYSKHHSGLAVDFGCGDDYLVFEFADTPCYQWMSFNNFERTKKHGLIPSYPNDVDYQGPNPEPWEYVYVGQEVLK